MMNKTKNITFTTLFALFAFILMTSLVSAASLTLTTTMQPTNVNHDEGSFVVQFELTNTGVADLVDLTFSGTEGTSSVTFPQNPINVATGETKTIVATVTFAAFQSGNIAGSVTADPQGTGDSKTSSFSVPINAEADLELTTSGTLSPTSTGTLNVKNTGNVVLNVALSEVTTFGATLSSTSVNGLLPGADQDVTVTLPSTVDLDFGNNLVTIKGKDASKNVEDTATFTVKSTFCSAGSVGGDLRISDVKVDNQGEGKDDEWILLDTIEVEVQVDNDGNDDIDDVFVELAFYDSSGNNQVNDFEFDNADEEEYDLGKIKDGKDETATFKFKVPADYDDGNYKLSVKAYSDDLGESVECTDTSTDLEVDDLYSVISVERESDEGKFIAFENSVFGPSEATCGESITLTTDVYNIGDEDQDQVKVILRNSEMNLNEFVEIRTDLDQGDKESILFNFVVPQGLSDKIYTLDLTAEYDYKNGNYREGSDSATPLQLKVLGCKGGTGLTGLSGQKIAAVNAVLDSDAIAGQELVVIATITNLKTETASFVVDALDFQSWGSLVEISGRVFELDSGESKDVVLTFDVDEDAEGEESFLVEVVSGSESETREISVNIQGAAMTGGSKGPSFSGLGDNAYLWIIGIVNIVLVILIIVVAVRISRR
jgi:hypothetical protein